MPTLLPDDAELTVKRDGSAPAAAASPEETQDLVPAPAARLSGSVPAAGFSRSGSVAGNSVSRSGSIPPAGASRSGVVNATSGGTTGAHRTSARAADAHFAPSPNGSFAPAVPGYVVKGEIARGGMGVVLAARDVALNREVAIKTLLPGTAGSAIAIRRFVEEARITARLPHPGIPPIHALGTLPDGRPYLAMKLIKGRTLAAILAARVNRPSCGADADLEITAPHSPGLLQVFEQICQAVAFAHSQNVIHRDLKPANVLVGDFGETVVIDWGLAKDLTVADADDPLAPGAASAAADTMAGAVLGTPGYTLCRRPRWRPTARRPGRCRSRALQAAQRR
jgi:serine/threonine protein kinase